MRLNPAHQRTNPHIRRRAVNPRARPHIPIRNANQPVLEIDNGPAHIRATHGAVRVPRLYAKRGGGQGERARGFQTLGAGNDLDGEFLELGGGRGGRDTGAVVLGGAPEEELRVSFFLCSFFSSFLS